MIISTTTGSLRNSLRLRNSLEKSASSLNSAQEILYFFSFFNLFLRLFSPSSITSQSSTAIEDRFLNDFTCCGLVIDSLHDLLSHFEDEHVQIESDTDSNDDDDLPFEFDDNDQFDDDPKQQININNNNSQQHQNIQQQQQQSFGSFTLHYSPLPNAIPPSSYGTPSAFDLSVVRKRSSLNPPLLSASPSVNRKERAMKKQNTNSTSDASTLIDNTNTGLNIIPYSFAGPTQVFCDIEFDESSTSILINNQQPHLLLSTSPIPFTLSTPASPIIDHNQSSSPIQDSEMMGVLPTTPTPSKTTTSNPTPLLINTEAPTPYQTSNTAFPLFNAVTPITVIVPINKSTTVKKPTSITPSPPITSTSPPLSSIKNLRSSTNASSSVSAQLEMMALTDSNKDNAMSDSGEESEGESEDGGISLPISMRQKSKGGSSGGRPYRCKHEGCDKVYKNPGGLKYHLLHGHCEENADPVKNSVIKKPFQCPEEECGKRYKNLNGLKYHIEHSHMGVGKIYY